MTTDEANVIGKQVDLRWDCWKEFEGTDKAGRLSSCSTSTGTSRAMAGRRAARPRTLCRRTSTTTFSAPPCCCKLSRRECTWPRSAHASMQGAEHSNLGPTTCEAPTDDPLMCMACRESSAIRDRRARSGCSSSSPSQGGHVPGSSPEASRRQRRIVNCVHVCLWCVDRTFKKNSIAIQAGLIQAARD